MTLWDLKPNLLAQLGDFVGTSDNKYHERMAELGFNKGEDVRCLKITPFGGPRVYTVGGSVYSLDRELAQQISIVLAEASY